MAARNIMNDDNLAYLEMIQGQDVREVFQSMFAARQRFEGYFSQLEDVINGGDRPSAQLLEDLEVARQDWMHWLMELIDISRQMFRFPANHPMVVELQRSLTEARAAGMLTSTRRDPAIDYDDFPWFEAYEYTE